MKIQSSRTLYKLQFGINFDSSTVKIGYVFNTVVNTSFSSILIMHLAQAHKEATYPMILCVDDDPCVVDALGRQLHWYKVRVTKALHGMQGIWLSQVAKPDLIITDLRMPMCDGHELVRVVNQVPVVIVTGFRDDCEREALIAAGAAEVLYKPVDSRVLMDVIKRFVRLEKRR